VLQIKHWSPEGEGGGEGLNPGDVLASNHPQLAGGSHLPDITVITPVFSEGKIVFFVASRGHHADVGGITPGSMPPNSHSLVEEGAAILSCKLVKKGAFQVHICSATPSDPFCPLYGCTWIMFWLT
jgi:5-oxoprolinase (ATP-hydrolysing)